jgi:hypothetical protein
MKISIKTFAAIAVITAFALFACADPEIETPSRSISDAYANYNPAQLGGGTTVTFPTITYANGGTSLVINATPAAESDRDLLITFPAQADVLRQSNANMENALQKFLSFNFFTTPDLTGTVGIGEYFSKVEGTAATYTFVSREGLNGRIIRIRLDTIPTSTFVAVFNENYTYGGGYKVNLISNTNSKTPVYGNGYQQIDISTTTTTTLTQKTFVKGGHQGWSITVGDIDKSFNLLPGNQNLPLSATITKVAFPAFTLNATSYLTNVNPAPADPQAKRKELLDEFKDKFSLEKFGPDSKNWVPATEGEIKYFNAAEIAASAATIDGLGSEGYYAVFTPADLTAYRIAVNGAANLETKDAYYGQKQKINVITTTTTGGYFHDKVYSEAGFWYDTVKHDYIHLPPIASTEVTSDGDGLNVVVKLVFTSITPTGGGMGIYLNSDITTETFKKYFKIVGDAGNVSNSATANPGTAGAAGGNGNKGQTANTVTFTGTKAYLVGIKDVKIGTSSDEDTNILNEIVITLDPSYRLQTGAGNVKNFAIGGLHEFQLYKDNNITFSDPANFYTEFEGVKYWNIITSAANF